MYESAESLHFSAFHYHCSCVRAESGQCRLDIGDDDAGHVLNHLSCLTSDGEHVLCSSYLGTRSGDGSAQFCHGG